MTSLVKAGLVAKSWKKEPFHGIVTRSVVVFVVRKGNPKHIRSWNDLVKPGVDVARRRTSRPPAAPSGT